VLSLLGSCPAAVRQDPQAREEIGAPLDFVDDDETAERRQGEQRIRETRHVGGRLQIEDMSRSLAAPCDLAGQGRLADLTCSEETDDGCARQETFESPAMSVAGDHRE